MSFGNKKVKAPQMQPFARPPALPKLVINMPPKQPKLAKLPPVPKPQEILDFIDEIAGVKFAKVRGPDGKERYVKTQLPRTPKEQASYTMAAKLYEDSMKGILELAKYDPQKVAPLKPYVDVMANLSQDRMRDLQGVFNLPNLEKKVEDFRQIQKRDLDQDIIRNRHQLEERLAHSGRSNSSYANQVRSDLQRQISDLRHEAEFRAGEYERGLEQHELGKNLTGYNLREEGRRAQLANAQTEYGLEQQQLADLDARRQTVLNEMYNQFKIGSQLRNEEVNKNMMTRAPELALNQQNVMNTQHMERYGLQNRNALLQHEAEINRINTGYGHEFNRAKTLYDSEFNRVQKGYENQFNQQKEQNQQNLKQFELEQVAKQAQGPSTGQILGGALGSAAGLMAGGMMTGPAGSGGAMLAGKLFG
jgi:hypothetical protein